MTVRTVSFDEIVPVLERLLRESTEMLAGGSPLFFVRDLLGRVRIAVPELPEGESKEAKQLYQLGVRLSEKLGARAYAPERALLVAGSFARTAPEFQEARRLDVTGVQAFLIDRQVTGESWSTVRDKGDDTSASRLTLYSIKGGVGRTTTTAVLATFLARQGKRVLMLDLDLEAPGLSTALLRKEEQPDAGIVDWFVEDALGEGDAVLSRMVARTSIARDLRGEILVAPAHGRDPGEYLAKLGRVHLDLPPAVSGSSPERWTARLLRLLNGLETQYRPDFVLLDSRSGLHDLAAALVTDIRAFVLLFAGGSEQTFIAYRMLFHHWLQHGAAESIRSRIKMVAAMVPEIDPSEHLTRLREASWDIFRDELYDEVEGTPDFDAFSFDISDASGPHDPLPIYWHRGLAAQPSLRALEEPTLVAAYSSFLAGMEPLLLISEGLENATD